MCVSVCGPGHLTSHDLLDTDALAQMAQSSVALFLNGCWRKKTIQKSMTGNYWTHCAKCKRAKLIQVNSSSNSTHHCHTCLLHRYLDFVDSNPQPCILCNNFWMGGGGVYVMSTIATMYDGDQKLKPRSSEKKIE